VRGCCTVVVLVLYKNQIPIYNENSIIILLSHFYYLIKKIIARDLRFKISLSSD
jgi:hypothetical protein